MSRQSTIEQIVWEELHEAMLRAAERLGQDASLPEETLLSAPLALFLAENVMRDAFKRWVETQNE